MRGPSNEPGFTTFFTALNKVLSQVNRFKNLVEGKGDAKKNNKKDNSDSTKSSDEKSKTSNEISNKKSTKKESKQKVDEAVEADSYEVPKQKKTSTSEKYKTARDFVNDVADIYEDLRVIECEFCKAEVGVVVGIRLVED